MLRGGLSTTKSGEACQLFLPLVVVIGFSNANLAGKLPHHHLGRSLFIFIFPHSVLFMNYISFIEDPHTWLTLSTDETKEIFENSRVFPDLDTQTPKESE